MRLTSTLKVDKIIDFMKHSYPLLVMGLLMFVAFLKSYNLYLWEIPTVIPILMWLSWKCSKNWKILLLHYGLHATLFFAQGMLAIIIIPGDYHMVFEKPLFLNFGMAGVLAITAMAIALVIAKGLLNKEEAARLMTEAQTNSERLNEFLKNREQEEENECSWDNFDSGNNPGEEGDD